MLAELDVVVFLKSSDTLERTAQRVFGSLGSAYEPAEPAFSNAQTVEKEDTEAIEETGNEVEEELPIAYQTSGLGFRALLFSNAEDPDPEFENFQFGLEITSRFWCVELDTLDLEGPLSEYFARQLAFDLDLETATEVLLETTEEAEIFEVRSYRRNPQYRLDQSPTTPRVFVVETHQYEQAFEEEGEYSEESVEETDGATGALESAEGGEPEI